LIDALEAAGLSASRGFMKNDFARLVRLATAKASSPELQFYMLWVDVKNAHHLA
jgi:hypothetical protein